MLAVVRRRIGLAAVGTLAGVLLIALGYRLGPSSSGGLGAVVAGTTVVVGWCLLLLVVFAIVVPALLPHR